MVAFRRFRIGRSKAIRFTMAFMHDLYVWPPQEERLICNCFIYAAAVGGYEKTILDKKNMNLTGVGRVAPDRTIRIG